MKKKQPDFGKNTLKVGRPVGRRRNEPNVKVKSTRLELKQKIKGNSVKTIQDVLRQIDSGTVTVRRASLPVLKKLIEKSPESLIPYVSKTIDCLLKCIQVSEETVRVNAMQVMVIVLEVTDDLQIRSFIPDIFTALGVLMTNIVVKVRGYSLAIVHGLLTKHPDLVCHSITLLKELLQMLKTPLRKHLQTTVEVPGIPYRYPISVLHLMNVFFKEMFKPKTDDMGYDKDEQEVEYSNIAEMLHLVVYRGSGLKPADIQKLPNQSSNQDMSFGTPEKIKKFINDILDILPKIFIEEVGIDSKSDDKILPREAIAGLNVILQLYCHIVEWADLLSYPVDSKVIPFLQERVYKHFAFDVAGRTSGMMQVPDCAELNLSTCYLFARFLSRQSEASEETSYDEDIFNYMKKVLVRSERMTPSEIKYISIPILIKIIKFYLHVTKRHEFTNVSHILTQLSTLLRQVDDRPNSKLLIAFLVELSLNPEYDLYTECPDTLREWFNWLLKEGAYQSRHLLKVIQKIAARKFSALPLTSSIIKNLLNFDDEEVRNTALILIYHMSDIPLELLEDISRYILLDPTFTKKSALRFIRVLKFKFCQEPDPHANTKTTIHNGEGFVTYAAFLLNLALDSHALTNKKLLNYDTNDYTRAVKVLANKQFNPFSIIPSLHWREHSEIFEECLKNLKCLPQIIISELTMEIICEILKNTTTLPMHCAIAIFKLFNACEMAPRYARTLISELIYSGMLTLSVLSTAIPEVDEWYEWNVHALMVIINIDRKLFHTLLDILTENRYEGAPDAIVVYHVLRVFSLLLQENIIIPQDGETVASTLEFFCERCSDRTITLQPLYQRLMGTLHPNYYK